MSDDNAKTQFEEVLSALSAAYIEVEQLRAALRDLLQYCDDHNWGTIPEGATIDRARAALGEASSAQAEKD